MGESMKTNKLKPFPLNRRKAKNPTFIIGEALELTLAHKGDEQKIQWVTINGRVYVPADSASSSSKFSHQTRGKL